MSQVKIPTFKLNDGNEIPVLGLGTANTRELETGVYRKILQEAIDVGYRHFDTAWLYGCQPEVGAGLQAVFAKGELKREDFFITSKVWNTFHKKESVIKNCKTTLEQLNMDYVDLFLMHFPMGWKECEEAIPTDENGKLINSDVDYLETWQGMEECLHNGWVKSIGVSNFNIAQVKRLLENCKVKPVINQVETHPYLAQQDLVDFCKKNDVLIEAYSPLGAPYDRPNFGHEFDPNEVILMENPVIESIAHKHGRTNAQVLLRWGIQRGTVVLPKTVTKTRMIENFDLFSFELDETDMKQIAGLERNWRAFPFDDFQDHPFFPW